MKLTNKQVIILFATICGVSVTNLDQTILPVALPTIQSELVVDGDVMRWVINGYFLAATVLYVLCGRLADMFGQRKVYLAGLIGFGLSSVLCAMASSGGTLIFGRVLQGMFAATISPSVISILMEQFPKEKKGWAIGMVIGASSLFLILGPLVGGLIAQYWGWRYIFYINVPIVLIGGILTMLEVPKSKRREGRIDFLGFSLLTITLLAFFFPLMQVSQWGWSSARFWIMIASSVPLYLLLRSLSETVKSPIMDFSLFKIGRYKGGLYIVFVVQVVLSLTVFWPLYMQRILEYSPVTAGILIFISIIPVAIASPISGKMHDSHGVERPAMIGFTSLVLSMLWTAFAFPSKNMISILIGMILLGLGIPMILTSIGIHSISSAPEEKRGEATGIYNTFRFAGATFGVALLGTVITTVQRFFFKINLQNMNVTHDLEHTHLLDLYERSREALSEYHTLVPNVQRHVLKALDHSTSYAFGVANIIVILFLLYGIYVFLHFFPRQKKAK